MIVAIIMIIINLFIDPIQITFDKFYFIFQKSSSNNNNILPKIKFLKSLICLPFFYLFIFMIMINIF